MCGSRGTALLQAQRTPYFSLSTSLYPLLRPPAALLHRKSTGLNKVVILYPFLPPAGGGGGAGRAPSRWEEGFTVVDPWQGCGCARTVISDTTLLKGLGKKKIFFSFLIIFASESRVQLLRESGQVFLSRPSVHFSPEIFTFPWPFF